MARNKLQDMVWVGKREVLAVKDAVARVGGRITGLHVGCCGFLSSGEEEMQSLAQARVENVNEAL